MPDQPVVCVALSGGIDSLVTGFLLKKQFKNIFGIHFVTGYETRKTDILQLEKQLGFDIHTIDLSNEFEKQVVQYFISTYLNGQTPNPCLICNQKIKFGELMTHADRLGADLLATGHYVTVTNQHTCNNFKEPAAFLQKGSDPFKDQSYFLSLVNPDKLGRVIFPLAGKTKDEVRIIAREHNLIPLHPSESQDICFINDNDFAGFILKKLDIAPKEGPIVDPDLNVIGTHTGLHQFTIGQRRGINCPASQPYYVKKIDMKNNRLHVCFKSGLTSKTFKVAHLKWNYPQEPPISGMQVKIRYSHKSAPADLLIDGTEGTVTFNTPQNAITPGQAAVFYLDDRVLGAGIIQ